MKNLENRWNHPAGGEFYYFMGSNMGDSIRRDVKF